MIQTLYAVVLTLTVITSQLAAQTYSYDFTGGDDGWAADFADYPIADSAMYELRAARKRLPLPLDTTKYALMISGINHSDDLFMFIKHRVTGLNPNATYKLVFNVEIASKAPTNAVGTGGAPGEGVTIKAGASQIEPAKRDSAGWYIMNIDKSNQTQPGTDMDTIGHVGVTDTTTVFALIQRSNAIHPFTITADADGATWLCIGTDSGFESRTTIYYNRITVSFTPTTEVSFDTSYHPTLTVYPNPAAETITLRTQQECPGAAYTLVDWQGRTVRTGVIVSERETLSVYDLPQGIYALRVGATTSTIAIIRN